MAVATPIPFVKATFFDRCGKPLAGGKVYTYEPNSTTPKATYNAPISGAANTNPIILDAAGQADIYLYGRYRIRVTTSAGILVNDSNDIGSWYSGDLDSQLDSINQYLTNSGNALIDSQQERIDQMVNTGLVGAGSTDLLVGLTDFPGNSQRNLNKVAIQTVDSMSSLLTTAITLNTRTVQTKSFYSGKGKGGDSFIYDSSKANVSDGQTIKGWVRQIGSSLNPMQYGAIADGTLYTVADWYTPAATYYRGYANLAAVQIDYPHVTASTDSIDWAAITAAANAVFNFGAKLQICKGTYMLGANELVFSQSGLVIECDVGTEMRGTGDPTSGFIVSFAKQGGLSQPSGAHPTSFRVKGLRVRFLAGSSVVGRAAIRICASYCTFEDLTATTSADVGANGIVLESDNTGSGPYYNSFLRHSCQGTVAGATGTGMLLTQKASTAIATRYPNANTVLAGRCSGYAVNYAICGAGNRFIGATSENGGGLGVAFKWLAPVANSNVSNQVISPYIENAATGFQVDTLCANPNVVAPYTTGVVVLIDDPANRLSIFGGDGVRGLRLAGAPTTSAARSGLYVGNTANADTNTLDWYEEGTWTPTLAGATTAGDYTVTTTGATFTRVGNVITAQVQMSIAINTAGSGVALFSGLPYPRGSNRVIGGSINMTNVTIAAGVTGLAPRRTTSGASSDFFITGIKSGVAPVDMIVGDILAGASITATIIYTAG